MWRFALRDLAIVGLTSSAWLVASSGLESTVPSLLAGIGVAVCGFLAHEWGHLAGARLSGAVVHLPTRLRSLFLFRFDSDRNGRREFVSMSCGGFTASLLMVAAFWSWLPRELLAGRIAWGLTGAGLLATAVLEIPPFLRVLRGGPVPRGGAYHSAS